MKRCDWALAALRHQVLPFRPPTFELSMELTQELLGRHWITWRSSKPLPVRSVTACSPKRRKPIFSPPSGWSMA